MITASLMAAIMLLAIGAGGGVAQAAQRTLKASEGVVTATLTYQQGRSRFGDTTFSHEQLKIARSGQNDVEKYLLAECMTTYMKLAPGEQQEFTKLQGEQFPEGKMIKNKWFEEGRLEGELKKGRSTAMKLMEKKFGGLSKEVVDQLEMLPMEQVDELLLKFVDARSLADMGLGASGTAQ